MIGSLVSRLAFGALIALGILAAPLGARFDLGPEDLLLRYLDKGRYVTYSAIVEHRRGPGSRNVMQFKVEQDSKGRIKYTLLQPISMQGMVSVDDGKTWTNYHPDENRLMVQMSPRVKQQDPQERIKLATRNYSFELVRDVEVAGRKVLVVVAKPKSTDMPIREYSIDPFRNTLLKLEIKPPNDDEVVLMDTKSISYPRSIPSETFEITAAGNVRKITLDDPKPLESVRNPESLLGFRPVIPKALPDGFELLFSEIAGPEERQFLAVRITDGLVFSTVMQSKMRTEVRESRGGRDHQMTASGVAISVSGDIPEAVRKRILEAFVKANGGPLGPTWERPRFASSLYGTSPRFGFWKLN